MINNSDNVKEWKELLEKWKNFNKVYDAIFRAYQLGFAEGVEVGKEEEKYSKAETMDVNNKPLAE